MRITHPFHPLFGQEFVRVAERSRGPGEQVWYEGPDGSVASIPRGWTNLAACDAFVLLAEGKAHFRPEDLVELVALVAAIRDAAPPGGRNDV